MILALTLASALAQAPQMERYGVESSLVLPRPMWILGDTNIEARISEVTLAMSVACGSVHEGRERRMDCVVEQAGLRAAPMPGDAGRTEPILKELESRLVGSRFEVRFKRGRVIAVAAEGRTGAVWRRTRRSDETIRLLLSRAVAGFDFKTEARSLGEGQPWSQRRTWLAQAPIATGSVSTADLVHAPVAHTNPVEVRSGGKVQLSPAGTATSADVDWYTGEVRALGHVDDEGRWLDRRWQLVVHPTPDSAIANGPAGLSYEHRGSLRRLAEGEVFEVGQSAETEPSRPQPTALQSEQVLGVAR